MDSHCGRRLLPVPDEFSQTCRQRDRLILRHQRVAVLDLDEAAVGKKLGESPPMLEGHDAILFGPDDEHRALERPQCVRGRKQVSLPPLCICRVLAEVASDSSVGERAQPLPHDLVWHPSFGHPSEGHRELAYPSDEKDPPHQGNCAREFGRDGSQPSGKTWWVVLEGFARDEHEPSDPLNSTVCDHDLSTAPVVEAERRVFHVDAIQELGDNPSKSAK